MSATPGRIERDPQTRSPAARGFRGFPPAREDGSPLLELSLFVDDVLARDRIVLLDLDLVGRGALVLGRGVEVAGAGRGFELDLFAGHGSAPQTFSPRARISVSTTSMPFLSMSRRPALERRIFTQRFSLSTQNRRYCRLGR